MSETTNSILLKLSSGGITLENSRAGHIASLMQGRESSDAIGLMTSLFALCPAAHVNAFTGAFEAAESGIATESIALLSRIEAVLETIRFFSMDLRKTLGVGVADKEVLTGLAGMRSRLAASLQGQSDTALMADATALSRLWLKREALFFEELCDRAKEVDHFNFASELLLQTEELTDVATLQAIALTLKDCPPFALTPRLGGARVVGAIARGPVKPRKSLLTVREVFRARIDEITGFVSGKSSPLGSLKSIPLGNHEAASLVETARGVLLYFVRRDRKNIVWLDWIAPTEWVFQNEGIVATLAEEAFEAGASDAQISLIAAAFDACAEVNVIREAPHA